MQLQTNMQILQTTNIKCGICQTTDKNRNATQLLT